MAKNGTRKNDPKTPVQDEPDAARQDSGGACQQSSQLIGSTAAANSTSREVAGADPTQSQPSGEHRRRQIAEAAYYRALERGFEPGYEEADWIEAEKQIDRDA